MGCFDSGFYLKQKSQLTLVSNDDDIERIKFSDSYRRCRGLKLGIFSPLVSGHSSGIFADLLPGFSLTCKSSSLRIAWLGLAFPFSFP